MDCFDNLPLWAREKLTAPPGHKDWMQCHSCEAYKDVTSLKKCGGCSEFRVSSIYYCSKACQKSDWATHKEDCRILREEGATRDHKRITRGESRLKLGKMMYHWYEMHSQAVLFAMGSAYHFNKQADPAHVVFDVEIDVATFQIISFRFSPKNDSRYRGFFSQQRFSHLQGSDMKWFCILVNQNAMGPPEYLFNIQRKPVNHHDKTWITDDPGGPFPKWPWIAVHLTKTEDQRRWAAMMKWNLLITAVHNMRLKIYGSLDKFKAPVLEVGVTFIPPDMDLWYEKMNRSLIWDHMVETGYVKKTFERFAQGNGQDTR